MSLSNIIKIFTDLGFVNEDYIKNSRNELVHLKHDKGIEITIIEDEFGTVTTKLVEKK